MTLGWRGKKEQETYHRKWVRENVPEPGVNILDIDELPVLFPDGVRSFSIDQIPVLYGFRAVKNGSPPGTEIMGQFAFIEVKSQWLPLESVQVPTFSALHFMLTAMDPDRKFYLGFYLIQSGPEDWDTGVRVNGLDMDPQELAAWYLTLTHREGMKNPLETRYGVPGLELLDKLKEPTQRGDYNGT